MRLSIKKPPNFTKFNILKVLNFFLFLASFFNSTILLVWTLFVTVYYIKKEKSDGCLHTLLIIQVRSILNPGLAISYAGTSAIVKWIVIFLCSFFIFYYNQNAFKVKKIINCFFIFNIFILFITITSFIYSSYPITAVFKIISYYIPFLSIIIGIYFTDNNKFSVIINRYLSLIVFFSVFLFFSPLGYFRNGIFFQGLTNHPNLFAIIIPLFIANYLYLNYDKFSISIIFIVLISFILLSQTQSRTGMISFCIIIIIYLYNLRIKINKKLVILGALLMFSMILYTFNFDSINKNISDYIYKGHDNILESRESQQQNNLNRFYEHPLCGTGFNVPYDENIREYSFSFDLIVENGNLVYALLGDIGIIGLILFIISYGYIFFNGKGILLFIAPLLVCMGEMTFFSTNNLGILLYFFYGIYFKGRNQKIC